MVNKRETIKFLIEKCYKNFPELVEEIPEKEMYKVLKRNILAIITKGKSEDCSGFYYPGKKIITLLNKGNMNLEDIKKDADTTGTLAHEGVHALFRKNLRNTGVYYNFSQINIKGFKKLRKARFKSSKTVLNHIYNLHMLLNDFMKSFEIGRALNEGITEWIKQKTTHGSESYHIEVNIVKQIENIVGAKKILETVNKKPKEMNKLLNMNKMEYASFCNQMDYVYFLTKLKGKIEQTEVFNQQCESVKQFNNGEIKFLNDEIKTATTDIQTQLINRIIIPYFKQTSLNNDEVFDKVLKSKKLIEEYCLISNNNTDMINEFLKNNEYRNYKNLIDGIVIQYAKQNIKNIDSWERKKVFETNKKLVRYGISNNYYNSFKEQLANKVKRIRIEEDANIIEQIKQETLGKSKIDINLLINDYSNMYSSYDVNNKVRKLLLNKKLTIGQEMDLIKEVAVYNECGKVISKKDIKKHKNEKGQVEYYVSIDGKKYTNPYLMKIKNGRKFVDSKKFEVREREIEEQQISEKDKFLSVIDNKKQGTITKLIRLLKERVFKKKEKDIDELTKISKDDFKNRLIVNANQGDYQTKQDIKPKVLEKGERD